jgi:zinc transporter, ZIP family
MRRSETFMIAIGIGLHNLGEGLAIGSAYAVGELALGTALVVGFVVYNTTEGLAIVAPLVGHRSSLWRLGGPRPDRRGPGHRGRAGRRLGGQRS